MFGVDWSDPQTLWLNLTNLGLGILIAACIAALAYAIFADLFAAKVLGRMKSADPHMMHTPELGMVMADGGEPDTPKKGRKQ